MLELYAQEGGLHFIQARVVAFDLVIIFHFGTIITQGSNLVCQNIIVCGDGTGIAQRAQVLSRIETESRRMTKTAALSPLVTGTLSLGGILDHLQVISLGECQQRIHIRRLPVKMNRQDGTRSRSDRRLDTVRVEIIGAWVWLHSDGSGTRIRDGQP